MAGRIARRMPPIPPPGLSVFIPEVDLLTRIDELAREIAQTIEDDPPILVAVLEGARTFAGHLRARLPGRPRLFGIRASSYGAGTVTSGTVRIQHVEDIPVNGRALLLIEDIVDTGHTLHRLLDYFSSRGAADIAAVTLLSKPSRRVVPIALAHTGFEIEDRFVVGFGMDLDGDHRELPMIGVLE